MVSKIHITGLCEGNSPVTCEFPAQRTSNAENVSIWWRHHVTLLRVAGEHNHMRTCPQLFYRKICSVHLWLYRTYTTMFCRLVQFSLTWTERGRMFLWGRRFSSPHYDDVIMGSTASQITSLAIVYSTVNRTHIKENIKAPRHWPLWGEFTGYRGIPRINGL